MCQRHGGEMLLSGLAHQLAYHAHLLQQTAGFLGSDCIVGMLTIEHKRLRFSHHNALVPQHGNGKPRIVHDYLF